jgi:DNA helicase II / ATP-dependent DNA helicase PcrA
VRTDGFTADQLRAITAGDGPLAIVAGPGCGKTTTLAGRIAYLVLERGVDPAAVLAVTFSTQAARVLRQQVAHQLGSRAGDVAIHTLHGLGRKVIDTWPEQLGYTDRPSVLHRDEVHALLAATAVEQGWDPDTLRLGDLAVAVDRHRLLVDEHSHGDDPLARLAERFEERLRRHGAIDFVAMLSLPLRLFRRNEQVLHVLQDAYRVVVVDEGQDLNPVQVALVQLLAARHRNLLVAGDPAQNLFVWLGADGRFLREFPRLYPDAAVVHLAHNHRSTARLVALTNALGDLLAYRQPLVTDNPAGPPARLAVVDDAEAEADFVARQLSSLLERRLLAHPGEAAVLFRVHAQAAALAAALRAAGVPYAMHGHADLFGARVVRDVLSYLRLAVNPTDRLGLARIVDRPQRGLRQLAATLVDEPTSAAELPMRAAGLGPETVSAAAALLATIYDLHAVVGRGVGPAALLDRVLDRTGYRAWLERRADATPQLRTVARLRTLADRAELPLAEWLDALAVGEDLAPDPEETTRLCTLHRSKGREWRATFLVGVQEGLLPHHRAMQDETALEAELRLGYVGFTRCRERLYVSYGRGSRPSRWLSVLPSEHLAPAA